jgi:MFS family permease
MVAMLGMSGGYALFMGHGVIHLQDLGHTPAVAATAISVMVIGDLLVKIVIAALGDRIEPRLIWAAVTFIFAIGLVLVVNARSVAVIYTFAICLGIGFGGGVVLVMTVLGNYFGSVIFASVTGMALAVQTTISAIVPVVGGYYYDLNGSYAPSFYLMAALTIGGALMLVLLRPPYKREVSAAQPAPGVPLSGEPAD